MRLARLELLRYGRFTDKSIELPQAERDIHIVFGPNEAGKTTSLTAIEDLLFGIPERSPYNFLHNYDAMRIGAVLEQDGERFEFQRRKGRRDMILGPDGEPLAGDERLLAPFLGGADRTYFDRMFNLSHGRLADGGRAIIEAKDDIGQMLFAAGTGLADLRERLKQMEEEADGIWAPRKSERRLYYQAQDRLEKAQSSQREHSLSVSVWRAARKALSDAESTCQDRQLEHEARSIELKKLARIRRVHGAVRQRQELTHELSTLGEVVALPKDAGAQLAQAKNQDAEISARVSVLKPQMEKDRQALESITLDEVLVRRSEDIAQLNEQRIAVRSERNDLPKRRDEYRLQLEALGRLAGEIDWRFEDSAELVERVPPRSKVELVRMLLARHGELATELRGAQRMLEEAQAGLLETTQRLKELGEASDVSDLAAVLAAVREIGDVAGRMRTARGQLAQASEEIDCKVRSLKPALRDGTDIEALAVPPRDAVVVHRDDLRELARRQNETKQRLTEARHALQRDREAVDQRVRDEGLVTSEAVRQARSYRDTLWELVKARYIEHSEIPAEEARVCANVLEDLPASFTGAIEQADSASDRRFDKAQDAAELAVMARNIAGHEVQIELLEAEEAALTTERERLERAWQMLWANAPIELSDPDEMLLWLHIREEIVGLIARRRAAQRQLDDCQEEEREGIAQVQAVLKKLGRDGEAVKTDTLRVLVERADGFRREQEAKAEKIEEMREAVRTAKAEAARRQSELEKAQAEQENWLEEWGGAVRALGLEGNGKPEIVTAQVNAIEEMREHAGKARDLRDNRIGAIEYDIAAFEKAVGEVIAELAPDLAGSDADAAVVALDHRREETLKLHQRRRELTDAVADKQKQIDELEESRKTSWASVQPLFEAAGVKDVEALRLSIEQSDRLRALNEKIADLAETLTQQGGGLAIEALEEECRDVDIDAVQAKEEAAEAELKLLGVQLQESSVARAEARKAFKAIGGDDAAARAEADRQEALAAMQDAAGRYIRVRASAILLRWAIDRYRKEKQGPLLKRAGELFRVLTLGSFERLEVRFDERENMHLTGMRPKGQVVAVPGMSTGTEDQLFLALRIAAVEDYLARAVALPFVADDLFINFDAERSAAGFEVLGELAEQTQVLFYTHHQHLVDVARETLGHSLSVVSLLN